MKITKRQIRKLVEQASERSGVGYFDNDEEYTDEEFDAILNGGAGSPTKPAPRSPGQGRPVWEIAEEIEATWPNVNYAARPYLSAMYNLETPKSKYGSEDGASIIAYFLNNAGSYRGPDAKRIKAELKKMIKGFWG